MNRSLDLLIRSRALFRLSFSPPPPPPLLDLTVSTNLLLSLTPSLTVFYRTMYRSIYPSYPLHKPIILFWIFEIQIMKTAITNSENHVHCLLIVVAQQHRERKKDNYNTLLLELLAADAFSATLSF